MNDELFRGMKPASPPAGLRDRALRAARAAAGRPEGKERAGVGFTRFDLAWVAALLLLLACNLLLSARGRSDLVATANGQGRAAATRRDREDRQLARELGVSPSLMAAARPQARPDAGEELRKLLDDPAFERL